GPLVLLAALLLEHADLRTLVVAIDHADDLRARHERGAGQRFGVAADQEDLVERQLGTWLAGVAVDVDDRAGFDAELPARGLDDGEHWSLSGLNGNYRLYHGCRAARGGRSGATRGRREPGTP